MSARIHKKVLRLPCECVGVEDPWAFSEAHPELFGWNDPLPRFEVAPTARGFFDYVLFERVSRKDSFGRTRRLTWLERRRYGPAFRRLFPGVDMRDVRFVAFCWYDGAEAPDYYE